MTELPANIRRAIGSYEPITAEGFTLFPITVGQYDEFLTARQAIEFMQQSLPVTFLSMPLLQAYWQLDYEAMQNRQPPCGLFSLAIWFLALALRVGVNDTPLAKVERFRPIFDTNAPQRLKCVRWRKNRMAWGEITPLQFQRLRPILAAQNGIALENDSANPELVQAERDLAQQGQPKLDASLESMVAGVAALCGREEREIYDWPILKLTNRSDAYKRILDFMVCGIGETNGTTWKGGNPVPSPWFKREKEHSAAMLPIASFAHGAAQRAVQNPGKQTT